MMKRRDFLKKAGLKAAAAAVVTAGVVGCAKKEEKKSGKESTCSNGQKNL